MRQKPAAEKVDLYNSAYGNYGAEVYREIRVETYGEDLGQTSWVTTEESGEIPRMLGITAESNVLEIGSGSGRYALQVASATGCRIVGVDVNDPGVQNANQLAASQNLADRVHFEKCDASQPLRYGEATFDAVFSNDVLCHIPGRDKLLRGLFRVLKPGGRLLFSDALVIGGVISHQEIAARSSIGYFLFSPPGENERTLHEAGFEMLEVRDTTENARLISKRWRDARASRAEALIGFEGQANFAGLQQFLATVNALTGERRLLRKLYLGQRPG
ncbi:MAG TPA: methyltransferase domain-containing protein [Candidatus Eisenbacteria bacterium]|nr:methyltransferase domain-containing protein [Candidatus Eisenbacteria bacterium]